MDIKQKVLICGDVQGKFKLLFSKVDAINKKSGPFDFLLCVGNFFGENNKELDPYKQGKKKISIPTYIIGPNEEDSVQHYPDVDGCELTHNLTYLGKRGLYTSSSGLKIGYLSGVERDSDKSDKACTFSDTDVEAVKNSCLKGQTNFRGIDVLLTSQWPDQITNYDPKTPEFVYEGSKLISWLATHIKPRYHVCAMEDIHYERPPYRNQSQNYSALEIATRFIALASVGNTEKKRWLYALNLTPVDQARVYDLGMQTTDETQLPYSRVLLNNNPRGKIAPTKQFFYDMESRDDKKRQKRPKIEFDQSKCWFCLSSPNVEMHLVISVGKNVYLALAKGGVVDDHFLILPMSHHQSLSILPDLIKQEVQEYKEAVRKYYETTDRVPVFFERNFKTSHCQLQAVPVHKNQAPALKDTFQEIASIYKIPLNELNVMLHEIAPPGTLYFYVELPDTSMLYYRIRKDFPLQFGREVVCCDRILDVPDRFDWKDCQMDKDEETRLAKRIQAQFQPYEIAMHQSSKSSTTLPPPESVE